MYIYHFNFNWILHVSNKIIEILINIILILTCNCIDFLCHEPPAFDFSLMQHLEINLQGNKNEWNPKGTTVINSEC